MSSKSPASVRWNEVVALFGGTFDPPHLGHRLAVADLFTNPGVRSVRVIPSPTPPHKPAVAPWRDRVEMARLCFGQGLEREVEIDLCEIERAMGRPGTKSYTFDTLSELKPKYGQLAFVIGTDQLAKLPTWHRFPEVLTLSHWLVLNRKGSQGQPNPWRKTLADLEASGILQSSGDRWSVRASGTALQVIETAAPEVSSTQIREFFAKTGKPPEDLIPSEVRDYLMKHRLYGTKSLQDEEI